jgi:hypothetical protein
LISQEDRIWLEDTFKPDKIPITPPPKWAC